MLKSSIYTRNIYSLENMWGVKIDKSVDADKAVKSVESARNTGCKLPTQRVS